MPPPIESVVVMANSHSLLRSSPDNQACLEKVIRDTRLVETIRNFTTRHQDELLTPAELRKMVSLLIHNDTPLNPDVLNQYGVDPSDLVTGVCCPGCGILPMERIWGKWHCSLCGHDSKGAHIEALRVPSDGAEYFKPAGEGFSSSSFYFGGASSDAFIECSL